MSISLVWSINASTNKMLTKLPIVVYVLIFHLSHLCGCDIVQVAMLQALSSIKDANSFCHPHPLDLDPSISYQA